MVDPDAPSRDNPTAAQWLHWLVVNIPGRREILGLRSSIILFTFIQAQIWVLVTSLLVRSSCSTTDLLLHRTQVSILECFQFFFKSWNIFRSSSLRVRPLRPEENVCEIQGVEDQSWVRFGGLDHHTTKSWKTRGWKLLLCKKLIQKNWYWTISILYWLNKVI